MQTWSLIIPGVLIGVAAIIAQVLSLRPSRLSHTILGLLMFSLCLVLNTQGIYTALDHTFGGNNILYLVIQITWVLSMSLLWSALVPFKTRGILAWQNLLLLGVLIAVTVLFFLMPTGTTEYRMASLRGQWNVLLLTQLVNAFSAIAAIGIVRSVMKIVHGSEIAPLRRAAFVITGIGFAIGIVTFLWRIFVASTYLALSEDVRDLANSVDGVLVGATTLGIAFGLLLLIGTTKRAPSTLATAS